MYDHPSNNSTRPLGTAVLAFSCQTRRPIDGRPQGQATGWCDPLPPTGSPSCRHYAYIVGDGGLQRLAGIIRPCAVWPRPFGLGSGPAKPGSVPIQSHKEPLASVCRSAPGRGIRIFLVRCLAPIYLTYSSRSSEYLPLARCSCQTMQ